MSSVCDIVDGAVYKSEEDGKSPIFKFGVQIPRELYERTLADRNGYIALFVQEQLDKSPSVRNPQFALDLSEINKEIARGLESIPGLTMATEQQSSTHGTFSAPEVREDAGAKTVTLYVKTVPGLARKLIDIFSEASRDIKYRHDLTSHTVDAVEKAMKKRPRFPIKNMETLEVAISRAITNALRLPTSIEVGSNPASGVEMS